MFLTMIITLRRRRAIPLDLFYAYWVNAHAAQIASRLPGIHNLHLHELSYEAGLRWPRVPGIEFELPEEDRFEGVPEPAFASEEDLQRFLAAMGPLMEDEANIFEETIAYQSLGENSQTFTDKTDAESSDRGHLKFLLFLKARKEVSIEMFRKFVMRKFGPSLAESEHVLKLRLHLFEPYADDYAGLDARGVSHVKPRDKQYQAMCEIVVRDGLRLHTFARSDLWTELLGPQAEYIRACHAFGAGATHTFRRDGEMTFAALRTPMIVDLITRVGAANQLDPAVADLVRGRAAGPSAPR